MGSAYKNKGVQIALDGVLNLYINMFAMSIIIFPYIYLSLQFLVFIIFNRIFRCEFIAIAIKCFKTIKNKIFLISEIFRFNQRCICLLKQNLVRDKFKN